MTIERKPSDYRELRNYIKEQDEVESDTVSLERTNIMSHDDGDLYLSFDCSKAGINFWDLHDEFEVDVVSSWHDPTKDLLSVALRLRVEEIDR